MPITQTRMIDLLEEHEYNVAAFHDLVKRLDTLTLAPIVNTYEELRALIRAELEVSRNIRDGHAIAERKHFNTFARRNNKLRERARVIRRANGIPERDSPEYRMNARRFAEEAIADREYDRAMGGRPIALGEHNGAQLVEAAAPVVPPERELKLVDDIGFEPSAEDIERAASGGIVDVASDL